MTATFRFICHLSYLFNLHICIYLICFKMLFHQDNGIYLRIILGTVNVSLISKAAKYAYKNDYELFKLRVTSVGKDS